MRQQEIDLANLLRERRLKVNEGTHKTLWRTSFVEISTVPICVTKAESPFGRLTKVFKIAVMEVKQDTECTMWSVAPVSITQLDPLKAVLSTFLAEKMECWKEGLKRWLEWLPDMSAGLKAG